jgi:hypothetical protein
VDLLVKLARALQVVPEGLFDDDAPPALRQAVVVSLSNHQDAAWVTAVQPGLAQLLDDHRVPLLKWLGSLDVAPKNQA